VITVPPHAVSPDLFVGAQ